MKITIQYLLAKSLYPMIILVFIITSINSTAQTINSQPTDSTVCISDQVSFSVSATGVGTLTYQWFMNGARVNNAGFFIGATSSTLSIFNVIGLNGDSFICVVSDMTGSITSDAAYLTVNNPPLIAKQTLDGYTCSGSNISFVVGATGSGLTFQWQEDSGAGFIDLTNSSTYSGTTSDSLSISSVTSSMNGNHYRCLVNGTCLPSVYGNSALLNVDVAPSIISQPSSSASCSGGKSVFTINASGAGNTYQWQENSGNGFVNLSNSSIYSGVDSTIFSINAVTSSMAGNYYRCLITGICSLSTESDSALLIIKASPSIITQPVSSAFCDGTTATFSLIASGARLNYQWQENSGNGFVNLNDSSIYYGTNSDSLFINPVTIPIGGNLYRCLVSGVCAPSIQSNSAALTINTSPSINHQPVSQTACSGSNISFTITVSGTAINYQWQMNSGSGFFNVINDTIYSGSSTNSLTISSVPLSFNGYTYRCLVSGICSPSIISDSANLIVFAPGTWLGTLNTHWGTAANWGCLNVPKSTDNVSISSGSQNMPVISDQRSVNDIFIDNAAVLTLSPSSKLTISGTFTNNGLLSDSNATIAFTGNSIQTIPEAAYGSLELNNSKGFYAGGNISILNSLLFINGCITLNSHNLTISSYGSISNYTPTSFVITNDIGELKIQNIGKYGLTGNIEFPIGTSVNSYNPALINNLGTADTYGVRVIPLLSSAYDNTGNPNGTPITSFVVNRTWIINENAIGGTNATITLQWNSADELTNFKRNHSFVSTYVNSNWTLDSASIANGNGPFQQSISDIISLSPFSIQSTAASGIRSINFESIVDFNVQPNPFNNSFSVDINSNELKKIRLQISDLNGRLLTDQTFNITIGRNHIDITNLDLYENGIYILQLIDKNSVYTKKLIRQD